MLEVQPGMITVLADTAIRGHDLDEAKAIAAKEAAMEAMKNRTSDMDYAAAQAELAEAVAQIQAIQKLRKIYTLSNCTRLKRQLRLPFLLKWLKNIALQANIHAARRPVILNFFMRV